MPCPNPGEYQRFRDSPPMLSRDKATPRWVGVRRDRCCPGRSKLPHVAGSSRVQLQAQRELREPSDLSKANVPGCSEDLAQTALSQSRSDILRLLSHRHSSRLRDHPSTGGHDTNQDRPDKGGDTQPSPAFRSNAHASKRLRLKRCRPRTIPEAPSAPHRVAPLPVERLPLGSESRRKQLERKLSLGKQQFWKTPRAAAPC